MQKLFLIRHGESLPAKSGERDFTRTLSLRGRTDIDRLATLLSGHLTSNAIIIHSSAKRTTETAEILAQRLKIKRIASDNLYHGTTENYRDALQQHSENEIILLVGHNPVITMLANELSVNAVVFSPGTCVEFEMKNIDSAQLLSTIEPLSR